MNPFLVDSISKSKDAALVISLIFNVLAWAAIWRLWKSREALQDKVTGLMIEMVKEVSRMTVKLMERVT